MVNLIVVITGCSKLYKFGHVFGLELDHVLLRACYSMPCYAMLYAMLDIYHAICYAMLYYTILYEMVWYGMVWYGMVWYGMVWYGMVWYGMVWYGIA